MIKIDVGAAHVVSGLFACPERATACYVFAHGAGAGMAHPFMAAVADGLFARGIASVRYQFPFMEQGGKRPDRPALAHATVRAATDAAARLVPSLPLFAGGKSFGGRMTSQAQADAPLPGVRGLIVFGFPLHAAKVPAVERGRHLADISCPMLILQGDRDAMADMSLLAPLVAALGGRGTLNIVAGADHAFHVPVRSGRTDAQALAAALDVVAAWIGDAIRDGRT